jgi:hypothetical protein
MLYSHGWALISIMMLTIKQVSSECSYQSVWSSHLSSWCFQIVAAWTRQNFCHSHPYSNFQISANGAFATAL